jgi:hypothetical protein
MLNRSVSYNISKLESGSLIAELLPAVVHLISDLNSINAK